MIVFGELTVVVRFACWALTGLLVLCSADGTLAQEKEANEKKPTNGAPAKSTPSSTPTTPAKASASQETGAKKEAAADEDPEVAKQRLIIERFMTVLERNPRRGTAFDKIYGFHIENGTVEPLAQQFRDRAGKKEGDYAAWMILGLIESQRGRDAAAVEAFAKAKAAKKDDAIAPYYHGQALVLIGRGDEAVTSFEEAIARKPVQTDLFEIIQALGRVHQRAQRSEQALAVWNLFEKSFPGDARVQEQIAVTLVEEGQFEQALPRYESLIKSAKDEYRRSTFQIEAAELKVKLKKSSEGIADLEKLLDKLNPDSWLFREVRRKIESVFLRSEDQEGLTKYYLAWVGKHAEDVDAMARLSRLLAKQARVPEAREWLDKALKIAPSRKELRLAFISQLVEDHRYADAIEQYKLLDQNDPNNPDYLREWGRLVMRDGSRPIEEKRKDAAAIWKKLLMSRATDPLATVQVADLLRNAGLTEEALPLYEKAVSLAPTAPQYREFLGEYLHLLKRSEEALATWKKIAEGKQRTPENLSRLAEVLSQFGYAREASVEIQAAAELDARDFSLQLRAADYQGRAEQLDGAMTSLGRAEGLAQNDEEREAVLAQRIRMLQQMGKLNEVTELLRVELEKDGSSAEKWYRLARYQEALRLLPEATKSIAKSLELTPNNIPSLSAAARIDEQAGAMASAVERFRKLSVVDRRSKTDYLTQVARLEVQMGRPEEALAAGRDLIAASPGNIEAYQFYADLCFRLNQREEGLTVLRRSVRANPTDPAALLPLAAALAADFRTDESIEIYWQAFEKSGALDDKISVITKLAELYMQQGQFDRLVERLDRGRKEEDTRREMTICLAQAHQTAGDVGLARQELQSLLTDDSRDTTLLQQVSKLAEADRDLPAAIRFQELLVKAAPAPETEMRLAQLYSASGDTREASAIFVKLAQREEDPERLLRIVDGLLATDKNEEVLAILEPKLRENAKNWELLYREGTALFATRKAEAATRFRAILALSTPDEEVGAYEKGRQARAARMGGGQTPVFGASAANAQRLNPIYRTSYIYEIRQGIGLEADSNQTGVTRTVWSPSAFFQARAAAIGWLSRIAEGTEAQETLQKELRDKSDAANSTPRDNWDWIYYTTVILQTGDQDRDATKKLAKKGDLAGHYAYLSDIQSRPENQQVYRGRTATPPKTEGTPMPAEELNQAVESLQALVKASDDPTNSLASSLNYFAAVVSLELKRAKREDEAKKLLDQIIARDKTPQQIATSMQLLASNGKPKEALEAFDRFAKADIAANDNRSSTSTSVRTQASEAVCQLMGAVGAPIEQVLDAFDRYISYHIRRNELRRQDRVASRTTSGGRSYFTTYIAGQPRNVQVTFPTAGPFWDQAALNVLRNTYEIYAAADLASDFTTEMEKRRTAAEGNAQIYWELARAYVEFWNGEKETAAAYFGKAAELAKQDLQLQFDLANLHMNAQNIEEALAVLDKIQPSDQKLVIQKETAILNFAQQLGDLERATIAAKRLFGMRLDPNSQMQLAESMRRLGMNEEAESILKRAERQTASRGSALAALMTQYLVEGKNDLASEAAYRILRSTRATGSNPRTGQTQDDLNRQTALRCLQQTGKLKDQITLLEAQLERSPQSEPLYNALGEYYTAAGDTKKSEALQGKLLALRPDDADLRYRIGMTYYQIGKGKEACDLLLDALKKKPSLFGNQYYEVISIFRSSGRITDLGKLFSEMDLRQLGRYYVVSNVLQYLMQDSATTELGMTVLKRAVEAYPEYGIGTFLESYRPEVFRNPEIAAMIRASLVPPLAKIKRTPWKNNDNSSYSSDGTINSMETNLMEVTPPAELAALRTNVAERLAEAPEWGDGQVLLGMTLARLGNVAEAKQHFEKLKSLDFESNNYGAMYGVWKVAQEYRRVPELRSEAIELYKIADASWSKANGYSNRSYGPHVALVSLKIEDGDRNGAREMLLAGLKDEGPDYAGNPGYKEYNRSQTLYSTANKLEQLEFTTEALRLYREVATYARTHEAAIQMYYGGSMSLAQQGDAGVARVVNTLLSKPDRTWVKDLFSDGNVAKDASPVDLMIVNTATARSTAAARRVIEYDEYGNPIRQVTSPRFSSLLVNVLKEKATDASLDTAIAAHIKELAGKYPADLPVAIAECIYALAKSPAEDQKEALTRLEKLIDDSPLEVIPAGKRPNARQRAAAAPQTAVWLVARECLEKPEWIALGNKLADRALSAAQRQVNDTTTQGLTFELAAAAAKRGDLPAAEAAYQRLIDSAVKPKVVKAVTPQGAPNPTAAPVANASPPAATPPTVAPRRAPVTTSQFLLAAGIAESAANLGLKEVSLAAIREAFSAGMPVADPQNNSDPFGAASGRAVTRLTAAGGLAGPGMAGGADIERPLQQVLGVWSRAKMPPAEVSQILEGIMMPTTRPREILIFGTAAPNVNVVGSSGVLTDTGLLGALADWAARADRGKEIEAQVAQRKGTVDSAIAGEALILYIALAKNDAAQTSAQIKALGERVKVATTASAQAVLSAAFTKVFERPELRDEAAPHLIALVQSSYSAPQRTINNGASQLVGDLLQHSIQKGRLDEVKTLVDGYLKSRVSFYTRYASSDTGNELQYADYAWAACVVSRAGDLNATLEALARLTDAPTPRRNADREYLAVAMWHLKSQLAKLPAPERYKLLRTWLLPTDQRRTIRSLASPEIQQPIPTELAKLYNQEYRISNVDQILSTGRLLVDTAVEAGKLDELEAQVKPLLEEKLPQSSSLALLIALTKKDAPLATQMLSQIDARIKELIDKAKEAQQNPRNPAAVSAVSDFSELAALMTACSIDTHREPTLAILEKIRTSPISLSQTVANADFVGDIIRRNGDLRGLTPEAYSSPPLRFWNLSGVSLNGLNPRNSSRLYAFDNSLVSIPASGARSIQFRYPITGDWTFTFEGAGCQFGYGGLVAGFGVDEQRRMGTEDNSQTSRRLLLGNVTDTSPVRRISETSNNARTQFEIRSQGGKLQFLVNGQALPESAIKDAAPSLANPWISISSRGSIVPGMLRNPRLGGSPQVLPSVDLIAGDRSDGWRNRVGVTARGFSDSATRLVASQKPADAAQGAAAQRYEDSWTFDKGEITGPRSQAAPKTEQAGIYYERPLQSGDKIAYEFFYEPGKMVAHPAIGNLDFQIQPEGVHLAWTNSLPVRTARAGAAQLVSSEQLVGYSVMASGATPLTLKSGDWNQAELTLSGDEVTLTINGQSALTRKLEPTIAREFALFHYPRESEFRVRNLKLTGNWPKTLSTEDLSTLLAWENAPPTRDQARVALALTTETGELESARELLVRALSLAPAQRYEALRNFVLPTDAQPRFRDRFDFNPAGQPGQEVSAPSLDLIAAAKEAGKLAELKTELLTISKNADALSPSADALLALLAVDAGDDVLANEKLKSLASTISSQSSAARAITHRAAWLAAYTSLRRPGARDAAIALAKTLEEALKQDIKEPNRLIPMDRYHQVDVLSGLVRATSAASPMLTAAELTSKSPQWIAFDRRRASDDAQFALGSRWSAAKDAFELFTSMKPTEALYRTPLSGKFTVACQARRSEKGMLLPSYANLTIYPSEDGKSFLRMGANNQSAAIIPIEPVGDLGEWFDYQIQVENEIATILINGKRVLRERITSQSAPWLCLVATSSASGGAIRNFSITGEPTIPREIALSKGDRIAGWATDFYTEWDHTTASAAAQQRARMYGEAVAPPVAWRYERDEINVAGAPDQKDCLAESLIRYQRPLETGDEITLDFYYEAGKTELSPAVGRKALLLKPDGLKTHQLTSLPFTPIGPPLGNESPVDGAKPISFKAAQWNQLKLVIEADQMKLSINGQEVGAIPRDKSEANLFGFFRRKNEIGAKVKNVVLKGAWPNELPK